jgi:predicted Rossmann fold nucleotide-binding protein DprA/Smf involved in DNA uptake
VETSGLTPAAVSSMLLQLELKGFVTPSPGGLFNRLK